MTQSQNSSAKIALVVNSLVLDYYHSELGESLKWHQIKNINFQVNQVGLYFNNNNYFLSIINKETQQLTSTGIMNHLIKRLLHGKRLYVARKKWKVLTLENLRFGFVIWLWSCAVTVAVFVVEIVFWSVRNAKIILKRFAIILKKSSGKVHPMEIGDDSEVSVDLNEGKLMTEKRNLWLQKTFVAKKL